MTDSTGIQALHLLGYDDDHPIFRGVKDHALDQGMTFTKALREDIEAAWVRRMADKIRNENV